MGSNFDGIDELTKMQRMPPIMKRVSRGVARG